MIWVKYIRALDNVTINVFKLKNAMQSWAAANDLAALYITWSGTTEYGNKLIEALIAITGMAPPSDNAIEQLYWVLQDN